MTLIANSVLIQPRVFMFSLVNQECEISISLSNQDLTLLLFTLRGCHSISSTTLLAGTDGQFDRRVTRLYFFIIVIQLQFFLRRRRKL